MSSLFRRYPLSIVLSLLGHAALAGMLFVVLETQYTDEEAGSETEIILAELVTDTALQEEMLALMESIEPEPVAIPEPEPLPEPEPEPEQPDPEIERQKELEAQQREQELSLIHI